MTGSVGQYTQGWMPWQAVKSSVGTWFRNQDANKLGMGAFATDPGAQNNECTWDVWLDTGTWKITMVHDKAPYQGIATFQFDGVSQGTIDTYTAGTTSNNYSEVTGITVSTAGAKTFKVIITTKNGSSSGYAIYWNSIALIRTSGTASVPGGSNTPGYTWQFSTWMGVKASVGVWSRAQDSTAIGGGTGYMSNGNLNDYMNWDIWLDAGTYKHVMIHWTSSDRAIYTLQLDGVSQGTIDGYSAGVVQNVYAEITGITVAGTTIARTFQIKALSKNASSSAYLIVPQSVEWIRTGA